MKAYVFIARLFSSVVAFCFLNSVQAGSPVWTLTPLTATTLAVPSNGTAVVQYQVTNQSTKTRAFSMQSISGITQITTGQGVCGSPFVLSGKASCTLALQIDGSLLTRSIMDGPVVCENGSEFLCYRPARGNNLHITQAPPIPDATITVTDSPLTLAINGPAWAMIINNTSLILTATNITSDFTGTALDGEVTETGNTCASVAPLGSCTLTYTPGSNEVPLTDFPIQGDNTNMLTAAIQVDAVVLSSVSPASGAASGGAGVTLSGAGFAGATDVTFGGVAATSVYVVNSTTVTAVTPAHATGPVDVVLTTPSGTGTDTHGYTYLTTAVGQPAYGGTIACLEGGSNNLIAATADNSTGIAWGGRGLTTGTTSGTDGVTNTATIVNVVGTNGGVPYAAQLCDDYQVDSQGKSPCEVGNTCYDKWFLPAGLNTEPGQLNCLYNNREAIGGFASGGLPWYWGSTEANNNNGWLQDFSSSTRMIRDNKNNSFFVRCVSAIPTS